MADISSIKELKDSSTPMMKQYLEVKEKYPQDLVFYRLGDFYEMFFDDAVKASRLLNLTLTHRGTNKGKPIPLAGVPFHAVDNYISRLIRMGESVVICEQIENKNPQPKSKTKTFSRKVSRIVTPGTATDDGIAPDREDNIIACVAQSSKCYGIAYLNLGAGIFKASLARDLKELSLYLDKINPAEIVYSEDFPHKEYFSFCKSIKEVPQWSFELQNCYRLLCKQFHTQTLFGFGIENIEEGISAAGALLSYVSSTQSASLEHIRSISHDDSSTQLLLDQTAQRNLELTSNLRGEFQGSLLSVLDKTATAMGSRKLRRMLLEPLRDNQAVNQRLDVVEALLKCDCSDLFCMLDQIGDLERISARIGLSSARPKDLMVLRDALKIVPQIKLFLNNSQQEVLIKLSQKLDPLENIRELLVKAIKEIPSTFLRDGNVFADGYNAELDELRQLMSGSSDFLAVMEEREKALTGISTLKVGFNSVSGYYIEVPRSQSDKVPETYHRKQTLKNNERYTTQELRELEEKTLSAQERSLQLEKELYDELLSALQQELTKLTELSTQLATLDAQLSLAKVADEYHYVRPELTQSSVISITNGRHPVIETLTSSPFVANTVSMGVERMLIITGPNMGGKSTYMRQTALLCIMARAGSYIPAEHALIGDIDRIFTRIGASDDLVSGRSTFMVEMEEASNILNNATSKSLVLMDEVGRGTSAIEGAALALAIATFLANRLQCLSLFSTHYSEICKLEGQYPQVRNLCFKADEKSGRIVFLYHVSSGSIAHSYAIEVGRLAGLPPEVISLAKNAISLFEHSEHGVAHQDLAKLTKLSTEHRATEEKNAEEETAEIEQIKQKDNHNPCLEEVAQSIMNTDLNSLTPLQSLNILAQLQQKLKQAL